MSDARIVGGLVVPAENDRLNTLFGTKPTIRVLFYTDGVKLDNEAFGLGLVRELILGHQPFYVDFVIDLVDRHDTGHAVNKITPELLDGYDQVWFFGIHQSNLPGMPENELTDPEVAALRTWMDAGGGVLISGDHSNPRLPEADPSLADLLNLGRAIGQRVPRAGELRVWEGLPDSSIEASHNTHAPDRVGTDLNQPIPLDNDAFPQELILKRFAPALRPHPLFIGRNGPIAVFPDHMHEGQLLIPEDFPTDTWPRGPLGQPKPEIVARGTDKRNGAVYGVVSTYDGAMAGVGRIVADSTWHHYFNLNLWGFPDDTILARITQFYVNLTLWLSPPVRRQEAAGRLLWWLAHHPTVQMVFSNPARTVGLAALGLLRQVATDGALEDLLFPALLAQEAVGTLPEDLLLGAVLNEYWAELRRTDGDVRTSAALVEAGLRAGIEEYTAELRSKIEAVQGVDEVITQGLRLAGR